MNLRTLVIASLVSVLPCIRAADVRATHPAPAAGSPHAHHDTTELGEHMEKMGRAFRALGREVADPARNADSLKQAEIIRSNAEAALKLTPAKAADVSADKRADFVADYREHMKKFIADVASLQQALEAGKNAEAAELVKKMKGDMQAGHKEFRKKKKDDM